ncbi:HAMP domain-containing sensor histidine kinase [Rhizobium sp.]|uniref:sensor histidine kinase n=1 Tax=Rhizobium sp. TaxID=391 RepID=UPI0028A92D7B
MIVSQIDLNPLPRLTGLQPPPCSTLDDLANEGTENYTASNESEVDALASVIIHETRQPLTAIATTANACIRWLSRDDVDVSHVSKMLETIAMIAHQTSEMMDRARFMFVDKPHKVETIPVSELLGDVIIASSDRCVATGIEIELIPVGQSVMVQGDKEQLRQVLLNLVANAIEAIEGSSSSHRTIELECKLEENWLTLRVGDTGSGISPSIKGKIFDRSYSTKSGGMGIGLFICQLIVGFHGGTITARNRAPYGAEFDVKLPISQIYCD